MLRPLARMGVLVIGSVILLALAHDPLSAGGGKDTKATGKDTKTTGKDTKTTPKEKIDPAKLKPDANVVKAQKEKAEDYYKTVHEVETVPTYESAHFLLVGSVAGKTLSGIAENLERVYVKATKTLEIAKDPGPWTGKLTIFFLPDAKKYQQMIRVCQRRKAEEDELGSFKDEGPLPHVVATVNKAPGELGPDGAACVYMGAFLLQNRAKTKLPEWLGEGFGRATTLHIWGANVLAADRRRTSAILAKNSRSVNDLNGATLKADEVAFLRASFMDYLAYSGRTAKLIPMLEGFRDDEKGNPGNFNTALTNAKTTADELTKSWHNYAKAFK